MNHTAEINKFKDAYITNNVIQLAGNIMTDVYDLVIIGGGISGFSAAMYAGRFKMKTLLLTEKMGGTLVLANDVANYPGIKHIPGLELVDQVREHAKDYDIEIIEKKVTDIRKTGKTFRVKAEDTEVEARTVILATGTEWRKLNVPGEEEFTGKGVHYCAVCDGFFYKDKVVGVVGGSDSAAKEALFLAEHAKKVYIIYRREKIRAEPINTKRVEESDKIEIIPNTNIKEIKGDKSVTRVVLDREYKGSKEFRVDGIFVDIGHIPLSGLAKKLGVDTNEKGEIKVDKNSATNVGGVFAAGDVVDGPFKQAVTGAAEGVTAAYSAYSYLK